MLVEDLEDYKEFKVNILRLQFREGKKRPSDSYLECAPACATVGWWCTSKGANVLFGGAAGASLGVHVILVATVTSRGELIPVHTSTFLRIPQPVSASNMTSLPSTYVWTRLHWHPAPPPALTLSRVRKRWIQVNSVHLCGCGVVRVFFVEYSSAVEICMKHIIVILDIVIIVYIRFYYSFNLPYLWLWIRVNISILSKKMSSDTHSH